MLSAAGVALLTFSVRAQDMAGERLGELAAIRSTGALMTGDLAQAAPRLVRDQAGAVQPAFVGGNGQEGDVALALVRRGWDNPDGASSEEPRGGTECVRQCRIGGFAYP